MATLKDGQRSDHVEGTPIGAASEKLNVSKKSIERAKQVQEKGSAELVEAVNQGKIAVSQAAR